jgi:hypothetical protein
MKLVRIRIKGSGQTLMLVPKIAYARINGGTAELVDDPNQIETATPAKPTETSDAPAQTVTTPNKPEPPAEAKKPAKAAETKSRR